MIVTGIAAALDKMGTAMDELQTASDALKASVDGKDKRIAELSTQNKNQLETIATLKQQQANHEAEKGKLATVTKALDVANRQLDTVQGEAQKRLAAVTAELVATNEAKVALEAEQGRFDALQTRLDGALATIQKHNAVLDANPALKALFP